MKKFLVWIVVGAQCLLLGCAIKTPVTNQFKLSQFSDKSLSSKFSQQSILITPPETVAAYDTEQMLYVKKPFEIGVYAHNAWIAPPADMLFPLLLQSIQRSGYFYVVASSPYSDKTDYRLDTQLLELHQNFLTVPSEISFRVKVVITHVSDTRVVGSQIISIRTPCPSDTPYGGVLAANIAAKQFTAEATAFVVKQVKRDRHS